MAAASYQLAQLVEERGPTLLLLAALDLVERALERPAFRQAPAA
jgi:hypothetical protein